MFDHEMECKNSFCQLKENCIFEDCPYRKRKKPKAEELVLFLLKKHLNAKRNRIEKMKERKKMAKSYIEPRRKLMKSRKYNGKCEHCGTPKPLSDVYCYVDDVNPAITYNAPYLCIDCYNKNYKSK